MVDVESRERAERLSAWLRSRVGMPVEVQSLERAGAGFSQDTLLCDVRWSGEVRELVVRLQPGAQAIFPDPSAAREFAVLGALGRCAEIPVPTVRWYEEDPEALGQPFFVMDRVAGMIPTDDPPFLITGWLHEAEPALQARVQRSTVDVLAAVHRVDWRALDLGRVLGARQPGLVGEVAYWREYLDWASSDGALPVLDAAYEWCVANRPSEEPEPVLCWGDARYGNVVYAPDGTVAAVLDWEMATLAPPELDVGWFLFLHDTALMWLADLPGFETRDAVVARYERALGRPLRDLGWYEAWAGVRAAAIQAQLVARAHARDHSVSLAGRQDNAVVASLRRLVDVPG